MKCVFEGFFIIRKGNNAKTCTFSPFIPLQTQNYDDRPTRMTLNHSWTSGNLINSLELLILKKADIIIIIRMNIDFATNSTSTHIDDILWEIWENFWIFVSILTYKKFKSSWNSDISCSFFSSSSSSSLSSSFRAKSKVKKKKMNFLINFLSLTHSFPLSCEEKTVFLCISHSNYNLLPRDLL